MGIDEIWQKVLGNTRIFRSRLARLEVSGGTELPYIFLAESEVNIGDTTVKKGKVTVDKPLIYLSDGLPQFYGFDFEEKLNIDTETVKTFFMLRGVNFPSFKYTHSSQIEVHEGTLEDAIEKYGDLLAKQEDVDTGLVAGVSDYWQFCILVYVAGIVAKSVPYEIKKLLEKLNENNNNG
jgi:hypothetical protein